MSEIKSIVRKFIDGFLLSPLLVLLAGSGTHNPNNVEDEILKVPKTSKPLVIDGFKEFSWDVSEAVPLGICWKHGIKTIYRELFNLCGMTISCISSFPFVMTQTILQIHLGSSTMWSKYSSIQTEAGEAHSAGMTITGAKNREAKC